MRRGSALFHALREIDPDLPIVVITAWASLEAAVALVKAGAADYLEKPWQDERLVEAVRNLVELRKARREIRRRRARAPSRKNSDLCGIVYASPAMHNVVSLAVSVADSPAPVLITGPSGSGKEKLAEIVQANSDRREGPFVRVNVGAIPAELMESELFGAEAGAFTGAVGRRIGHFESADGGTLFLDEIDGLPLAGQVKLLRVPAERRVPPARQQRRPAPPTCESSARPTPISWLRWRTGSFREDLYYRLNVVELRIPPLSRRADDVLPLARHFLAKHAADSGAELADGAVRALAAHDWPGNVRELENRIQRATVVAPGRRIRADDLGLGASAAGLRDLDDAARAERGRLLEVLDASRGVVAHAADELGISRQALYRKMDRLGIELERRPRSRSPLS